MPAWTPEQNSFIKRSNASNESIVLEAVAGSGKTTVLLAASQGMKGNTAIIAFNKSIADEISNKLKKKQIHFTKVQAGTCHSYGFKAYRGLVQNVIVDDSKIYNIVENYFNDKMTQGEEIPFEMRALVRKLVSLGKMSGIGLKQICAIDDINQWQDIIDHFDVNDSENIKDYEIIQHAIEVLKLSNVQRNIIDFNDMIYLSLLYGAKFFQFDNVMVDEAQDLSKIRMLAAEKMVKPNGRLIAVGDRKQAIYGFAGSESNSLDMIREHFHAAEMPLTVCFRCGKKIIEFANTWNPKIRAADDAIDGSVETMFMDEFLNQNLTNEMVMLCRNTKPLVSAAFALIRKGVPVYIEGRDIGEGLKKLVRKWKIKKIDVLINRLETWKDRESAKAREKKKEAKIQQIEDQFETLMVIIDRCRSKNHHNVEDVIFEIENIFKDSADGKPSYFTGSTIHRAKGREYKTVFWLDRLGTLPSKYAKQSWQFEQENNLCYVAATRAIERLVEVFPENKPQVENPA